MFYERDNKCDSNRSDQFLPILWHMVLVPSLNSENNILDMSTIWC